ncbi:MAG: GNAT family protein [Chloroflexota bacterium]
MFGPILRGEIVSLEPPCHDDLHLYPRWLANRQVTDTLLRQFVPSPQQEEEWFNNAAADQCGVTWRIVAAGRAIGGTGIHGIDWINRHGITGLFIGETSEWRKGYAREAVGLRTAYAFRDMGLERLESESMVDNIGMHRALEKAGYAKIGRRRHYIYRNGQWHDVFIFEVLRDEWMARQA